MAEFLCFILGLLLWTRAGGSTSQSRFIQTNRDLHLTVTEFQTGDLFFWKFNNSKNIIRLLGETIKITDKYKDRVDFFPQNLSLILKNVQLGDSGIYTAEVTGDNKENLATVDVTVQAPVSEVSLSVDSVSLSSESCNVTVSCTTESSSISRYFTCDNHTCEEPHPLTPDSALFLHLDLSNVSVICNHSNHVSWKNQIKNIIQVCQESGSKDRPKEASSTTKTIIASVTAPICLVSLFLAGAFSYRKRQKSQRMEVENTIYSTPDRPFTKPVPASEPLLEDPTSTYSLVGPHSAPVPQSSDTLYSTVNKPESNSHSQSAA